MTKIYSNITGELLHIIVRAPDVKKEREDFCPTNEFLQVAALKFPQGKTFNPHRHLERKLPSLGRAQETWIIVRGTVEVTLYDVDDTILHRDVLLAGDASITLKAGHNYEILSEDSYIFECKTGPYQGILNDKTTI